jgi:NADH-quinone oxidoreductase subunit G
LRHRFELAIEKHGSTSVAVQLSPEMSCEEAWLLATVVRQISPEAALVLGDVPVVGEVEKFPCGTGVSPVSSSGGTSAAGSQNTGETPVPQVKFTIHAEKTPNRRGIEMVIDGMGGPTVAREELWSRAGEFKAVWIVGGYPNAGWPNETLAAAAPKFELLIAQDIFPNVLTQNAHVVLPFCAWVERDGSFVNQQGLIQPFARAIHPPDGAKRDGQYLYELAGLTGLFNAQHVRAMMAEKIPAFANLHVPPAAPEHAQ